MQSKDNSSKVTCDCCTLRYAQKKYTRIGNLCEMCDLHHADKGVKVKDYPWPPGTVPSVRN